VPEQNRRESTAQHGKSPARRLTAGWCGHIHGEREMERKREGGGGNSWRRRRHSIPACCSSVRASSSSRPSIPACRSSVRALSSSRPHLPLSAPAPGRTHLQLLHIRPCSPFSVKRPDLQSRCPHLLSCLGLPSAWYSLYLLSVPRRSVLL